MDANDKLTYIVHSVSSYSAVYGPHNILVDNPQDQASRWSGANTLSLTTQTKDGLAGPSIGSRERQWVCLKLDKPAVVRRISFGKYMKPHPCNLREFKVYGGQTPVASQMTLLYHGGLKNDSNTETFDLRYTNAEGVTFPCEYIRIEPLVAHSQNYNVSIWHVALGGISDSAIVDIVAREYDQFRETKTLRLMLKHLRQRGMYEAFESVRSHVCTPPSNVSLEHPLLTQLYEAFVMRGDFNTTEAILSRAAFTQIDRLTEGESTPSQRPGPTLFTRYMQQSVPRVVWERLDTHAGISDVNGDAPGPRGGHQLIFCPATTASDTSSSDHQASIYLLGGWNGTDDLADFWRFDLPPPPPSTDPSSSESPNRGRWTLLSRNTGLEGGPGGRSCHKACLDEQTGDMYVLGRFIDVHLPESRERKEASSGSDFFRYSTRGPDAGQWQQLSADVSREGGPPVIYDHQMVVDSAQQAIYCFGGKIVQYDTQDAKYSGLYKYSIAERKWQQLVYVYIFHGGEGVGRLKRTSSADPEPGESQSRRILSRIGHSMLFDPKLSTLFIFAGQRNDTYLSDLWSYDTVNQIMRCLTEDYSAEGGPQGGFTQRATIDVELGEWHLLSGLMMDRRNRLSGVQNALWIRRADSNRWIHLDNSEGGPAEEPKPRFAHQMVYDPCARIHYLFGGNPAETSEPSARLGDFWRLELQRLTPSEVLRKARFLVRRQRFVEMCQTETPMTALLYLQNSVASVTDHSDEVEAATFRSCMSHLLAAPTSRSDSLAGSPAASVVIQPPRPSSVQATIDDEDTDAVMASSQDFEGFSLSSLPSDQVTREGRHQVFEELLTFFPPEHTQPREDLIDVAH